MGKIERKSEKNKIIEHIQDWINYLGRMLMKEYRNTTFYVTQCRKENRPWNILEEME